MVHCKLSISLFLPLQSYLFPIATEILSPPYATGILFPPYATAILSPPYCHCNLTSSLCHCNFISFLCHCKLSISLFLPLQLFSPLYTSFLSTGKPFFLKYPFYVLLSALFPTYFLSLVAFVTHVLKTCLPYYNIPPHLF